VDEFVQDGRPSERRSLSARQAAEPQVVAGGNDRNWDKREQRWRQDGSRSALHDVAKPQTLKGRSALPFCSRPLEDFRNLWEKARGLLDLWVTFCFHFLAAGKAGNQIEQFDLDS
jgi:hypothetical protein